MPETSMSKAAAAGRAMILPLALAQFIASYAATNMNVVISTAATDLGTTYAFDRRSPARTHPPHLAVRPEGAGPGSRRAAILTS